ncbi:MAG: hypothetical protein SGJ09_09835 [Phycisphaerae bacterium]|nr:hypothetical protein [Phycisphaerae bacterium]
MLTAIVWCASRRASAGWVRARGWTLLVLAPAIAASSLFEAITRALHGWGSVITAALTRVVQASTMIRDGGMEDEIDPRTDLKRWLSNDCSQSTPPAGCPSSLWRQSFGLLIRAFQITVATDCTAANQRHGSF